MHVAVTGASSGIGEALGREMARSGAAVTLVARRAALLEALDGELCSAGARTCVIPADLSDPEAACAWIPRAEAALGPIDVLINNAGVQDVGPFAESDPASTRRLLALDLETPLRLVREVLPGMLARRSGVIVNVTSLAGLVPTPGMIAYDAAKAGLSAASEALRWELRGTGVHVLTVYPGPVETAMARAAIDVYDGAGGGVASRMPIGTTDVLARRVRRAIERRSARVVYPRFYWLSALFPGISRAVTGLLTPRLGAGPSPAP